MKPCVFSGILPEVNFKGALSLDVEGFSTEVRLSGSRLEMHIAGVYCNDTMGIIYRNGQLDCGGKVTLHTTTYYYLLNFPPGGQNGI